MQALVDYENILWRHSRQGLIFLADRVVHSAMDFSSEMIERLTMRLYGGWYEEQNLSKKAQRIIEEITFHFPRLIWTNSSKHGKVPVRVNAELAYSLLIRPTKHLLNTYREKGAPTNLVIKDPRTTGCMNADCPLRDLFLFFKTRQCPRNGCEVSFEDVVRRKEQKLVDTMMTADMIHLTLSGVKSICVITSDDDLWPGIFSALTFGVTVVHLHTREGRRTPSHYVFGTHGQYVELDL